MAYLTYSEYQDSGGTLGAAAFLRYEFRARQLVDQLTHGRVRSEQTVRESVQRAVFDLIEAMAGDASHGGRELQSMSNDGVSVAYAAASPSGTRARYGDIVCEYLDSEVTGDGVALLYAGVDV